MSGRIVDLKIIIDGVDVPDESNGLDEIIEKIEKAVDTIYPIQVEVLNEEPYDD